MAEKKYKKVNTEFCYHTSWRNHLRYSETLADAKIKIDAYFRDYVSNNRFYTKNYHKIINRDVSWLICSMITAQRAAIELFKK